MSTITTTATLTVTFGKRRYPVSSVEDAQQKWVAFRDASAAGVSRIGNGVVVVDETGREVARISYNGRVWNPDGTERAGA